MSLKQKNKNKIIELLEAVVDTYVSKIVTSEV